MTNRTEDKVNGSETAETIASSTQTGTQTMQSTETVASIEVDEPNASKTITSTTRPTAVDPELDLFKKARVTQVAQTIEAGQKLLETIPIRKPSREGWVRTHDDTDEFWYPAPVIELKENGETYFLTPEMHRALAQIGEKALSVKMLVLTCGRNGVITLWPLRTPDQDGRLDDWSESALSAAAKARTRWVRLVSNRSLGAYEIMVREPDGIEPKWPELSMAQLMKIAFKGKIIDSMDHPVIRDLRGSGGRSKGRNAYDEITRILNS